MNERIGSTLLPVQFTIAEPQLGPCSERTTSMTFRRFCLSCFIAGIVAPLSLSAQPQAEMPASLAPHWQNLLEADAEKAYASMRQMARTPRQTLAFLRETVKPAVGVDVKVIEDLIRQLGSDRFAVREKAAQELERLE